MKKVTRKHRWLVFVSAIVLLGLIAVGCAAPAPKAAIDYDDSGYVAAEEPAAEESADWDYAEEPMAEEEFVAEAPMDDADTGAVASNGYTIPDAQQGNERMIIKSGDMYLIVQSSDAALDQIAQIAVDNGGYVLSSQSWQYGVGKAASITIAVRAENFEAAMRRIGDLAIEVISETSSGQDVTSEYVDLESRLTNLEATRDRLRTFLDDATTVEEALEVNQELSRIEEEIEQVKGRMKYLEGRSAFSTIAVNLEEPEIVTPTPTPTLTPTPAPWTLNTTVKSAVDAQVGLVHFLLEALTWLVLVLGPYIVIFVLIVLGVRALTHRRRARRAAQMPDDREE
ncbi:MAG: DUF4349 domain-containing protein [Anaerolineae bacterium]|nr:DUF4349 domain-containing protein [Anaerolineae bacterium]